MYVEREDTTMDQKDEEEEEEKKAIKIRDRDICVDYLDSDLGFITFNGERKRIVQSSL